MSAKEQVGVVTREGVRRVGQQHFQEPMGKPQSIVVPVPGFTRQEYQNEVSEYATIKTVSAAAIAESARILRFPVKDDRKKESKVRGSVVVPILESGRLTREVRRVNGWRQINSLQRSKAWDQKRMIESGSDPFGEGFDETGQTGRPPNDEFHPLLLGPFHRQMYQPDMLDMMSKVFEQCNHHPLARGAVRVLKNFTLGVGLKVAFKNPLCQDEWDAFERRTSFNAKMHLLVQELIMLGENFVQKARDRQGMPIIKLRDASTVWEIVTNPRDIDEVFYYYFQYPTQYQMFSGKVPASDYVIEQIPPEMMWHIAVNNSVGEKRGRSDLLTALGYLKRHRDILNAIAVKAQVEASFVWRKGVQGTNDDVNRLSRDAAANKAPAPGSNLWENERVKTEPLAPSLGGSSAGYAQFLDVLAGLVAVSVNIPPEYLGITGQGATRATALVKTDPSAKMFAVRQELIRGLVDQIADWVIADAVMRGRLPKKQPRAGSETKASQLLKQGRWQEAMYEIEVLMGGKNVRSEPIDTGRTIIFPDLVEEDRSSYLKDLAQGEQTQAISHMTYSRLYSEKMGISEYDYEGEQARIAEERELGIGGTPAQLGFEPEMPNERPDVPGADKPGSGEDKMKYREKVGKQ